MQESQDASELRSIPHVCEVDLVRADVPRTTRAPVLLLEVPHGATREEHFTAILGRLRGRLPEDLREFFFVNTDIGAPECARAAARRIVEPRTPTADPALEVLILRCLLPRTLVDCNRSLDANREAFRDSGFNPAVPDYVEDEEDVRTLLGLARSYHAMADRAYEWVLGAGGTAIILHTYAPRSVQIETVDRSIVAALRAAYAPERYATWPVRPDVDLITETTDGTYLAPRDLAAAVTARYAEIGISTVENATYRLDPTTSGHHHAKRHPGRVLCVEINRGLLADPFVPFVPLEVKEKRADRMAAPLAAAFLDRHFAR